MKKSVLFALGGLALLGASVGANAAAINGSVSIGGFVPNKPDLATVTSFTPGSMNFAGDQVGDLTNVTTDNITLNPFTFNPLTPNTGTVIWSSNGSKGFSFTLTDVEIVQQNENFLSLKGTGLLNGLNYDPTKADWTFTYTQGQGPGVLGMTTASTVPVPAAAWLFGSALLGLVGVARRRSSKV